MHAFTLSETGLCSTRGGALLLLTAMAESWPWIKEKGVAYNSRWCVSLSLTEEWQVLALQGSIPGGFTVVLPPIARTVT